MKRGEKRMSHKKETNKAKVKQVKKVKETKGGRKIYGPKPAEKINKHELIRKMFVDGRSVDEATKAVRAAYAKEGKSEAWLDFNCRGLTKWR
jgi:hypothetical protein